MQYLLKYRLITTLEFYVRLDNARILETKVKVNISNQKLDILLDLDLVEVRHIGFIVKGS